MKGEVAEAVALLRKEMAVTGGLDSAGVLARDPIRNHPDFK